MSDNWENTGDDIPVVFNGQSNLFASDIRGYNIKLEDLPQIYENYYNMSYEQFCYYVNEHRLAFSIPLGTVLKFCKRNGIPIDDESHYIQMRIVKRGKNESK